MHQKAKPVKENHFFAFRGLLKCGECGASITSERQKGHTYYRCTKKMSICTQKYIREEKLANQLQAFMQHVSIDDELATKMSTYLKGQAELDKSSTLAATSLLESKIANIKIKLDRLLDAHLDGTIDKEIYTAKKEQLLNTKIQNEQQLQEIKKNGNRWLELSLQLISDAKLAKKNTLTENFEELRNFIKKIGSNLEMREQTVGIQWRNAWELLAKRACGCGARGHEFSVCTSWQSLSDEIRAFFSKNPFS